MQSTSCKPTSICGSANTMSKGRIKDAGASAKHRRRPFLDAMPITKKKLIAT